MNMGWLWFIRRTQASPFRAALVAASAASELLAPLPEEREGFGGGGEYSPTSCVRWLQRPISSPIPNPAIQRVACTCLLHHPSCVFKRSDTPHATD
jgi:hypothetical protein